MLASDTIRQVGLVVGAGLATGVLTQVGQAWLPTDWSQATNAISPWLLVAFVVGSTMPDMLRAALAGAVTLLLALVGYNAMLLVQLGYASSASATLFWGLGAVVGGPVFGVAGRASRSGTGRQRAAALGLLVAVFVLEGVYQAFVVSYPIAGTGFVIVGLLLPIVLRRPHEEIGWAYVATIPALGLGSLGYVAFNLVSGLATRT